MYNCDKCGKEFELSKGQLRHPERKHYCSYLCIRLKDLTGEKFGKLTVDGKVEKNKSRNIKWKCHCECGNKREVFGSNLIRGHTQSCGCLTVIDITNKKFGRLTVNGISRKNKYGKYLWECECVCGNIIETDSHSLKIGNTKSCGCLNKEVHTTHNQTGTRLHRIWLGMLNRCNIFNKRISNYNLVSVCEEWQDFNVFYDWANNNGYKNNLTIDRRENIGDYCPDNCHWITRKEQMNNTSRNVYKTYLGKTQTITQWENELCIGQGALQGRIDSGMSEELIFHKGSLKKIKENTKKQKSNRLDRIWRGIKYRCLNPKDSSYKRYGGRGITVCEDWLDKDTFKTWAFANGYAKDLTIERKDYNKNYSPENCRWATRKEQNQNKYSNVNYNYMEEIICQAELARRLGISESALINRRKSNLPEEKLFHVGPLNKKIK